MTNTIFFSLMRLAPRFKKMIRDNFFLQVIARKLSAILPFSFQSSSVLEISILGQSYQSDDIKSLLAFIL